MLTNSALVDVWNPGLGMFEEKPRSQVQVTDLVLVKRGCHFPADLILLCTSEPDRLLCYVETSSFDGETNLKQREAFKPVINALDKTPPRAYTHWRDCSEHAANDLSRKGVVLSAEEPNCELDNYAAEMGCMNHPPESVPMTAVILCGCTLRQTSWVLGFVAQTGSDTKIMMSVPKPVTKDSKIGKSIRLHMIYLLALLTFCILISTAWSFWFTYHDTHYNYMWSLQLPHWIGNSVADKAKFIFVEFFHYFLMLYHMLPVSLYVSMTAAKAAQAQFIEWDTKIYHSDTNTPTKVRNMKLNEELGSVTHIFSDKTGTLTCNIMEFRKCVVNGKAYGCDNKQEAEEQTALSSLSSSLSTSSIPAAQIRRKMATAVLEPQSAVLPRATTFVRVQPNQAHHQQTSNRSTSAINTHTPADGSRRSRYCNLDAPGLHKAIDRNDAHAHALQDFFCHLSLSHTVTPQNEEGVNPMPGSNMQMSASSPDELAMVAGAQCMGFDFFDKAVGWKEIYNRHKACRQRFMILAVLEFNSNRKRMSIVVQEPSVDGDSDSGRLLLLTKGADAAVFPLIRGFNGLNEMYWSSPSYGGAANQYIYETKVKIDEFAEEGLRTLVIAQRVLDEGAFREWNDKYVAACSDNDQLKLHKQNRENRIDDLMNELECDLELLGATAVEDKLQDGVSECIHNLIQGGIKIWMCTGDKEETAINIASACRMLESEMRIVVINQRHCPTKREIELVLHEERVLLMDDIAHAATDPDFILRKRALVIDGGALVKAMDPTDGLRLKSLFKDFSCQCDSVVCCRLSPAQKAEIVELIKGKKSELPGEKDWGGVAGATTLAIGDGKNDVPMILKADVGVGISNLEGVHAVNNSDFAVAQFRFLQRLLLVHGRWNYLRTSKLVCYVVYKTLLLWLPQWWFFFVASSGQYFYSEIGVQLYNIGFTALPALFLAVQDQDVSADTAETHPHLYRDLLRGKLYNSRVFWLWVSWSIGDATVIFWVMKSMLLLSLDDSSLWVMGHVTLTAVVIVANVRITLHQDSWKWYHLLVLVASIVLWFGTAIVSSSDIRLDDLLAAQQYGVFTRLVETSQFFLVLPPILVICMAIPFFFKAYSRYYDPAFRDLIQTGEQGKGSHAIKVGSRLWKQLVERPPTSLVFSDHFACRLTNAYETLCSSPQSRRELGRAAGDGLVRSSAAGMDSNYSAGPNTGPSDADGVRMRLDSRQILADAAQLASFSHDEDSKKVSTSLFAPMAASLRPMLTS
eukprot:g1374.t1